MKKLMKNSSLVLLMTLAFISCGSAAPKEKVSQGKTEAFVRIESISPASQNPDGFAGTGISLKNINMTSSTVVKTKKELLSALSKGGLIYVDGIIDLSDGMLPSEGGSSNPALDAFVSKNSKFKTYKEYKDAYVAACTLSTEDSSKSSSKSSLYETMHNLNLSYRDVINIAPKSNTYLVGLTEKSGFKGGKLSINGVSNVIVRNLNIFDGYDPFPHHEENDGYNAQHDAISIESAKNIWIDHCTIGDTLTVAHVLTAGKNDEKWQTYDGLCDITKSSDNITVSYCKFMNHDKTMLIGSSDSESIKAESRKITLHHNFFYNCGQRLPMVRLTKVHTYNNYFEVDKTAPYKSSYALGVRYNCLINSENNYFGPGTSYSISGASGNKQGTVYTSGDIDKSSSGKKSGQFKVSKTPLYEIPYAYSLLPAEQIPEFVKANAGAGVIPVQK